MKTKKIPDYSVIMSVYKKVLVDDLKSSIESILNQTHRTNNFIIVKDGPLTTEQNKLIKKIYNDNKGIVKIITLDKNSGAGKAYNEALKICINDYAAIMDSDDYAVETKFEKQLAYLSEHSEIDAIGSNAIEFVDNIDNIVSKRIMPQTNDEIVKFAHARCPLIQPTVVFKVKSIIEAGGYQDSPLTEDYDLYIRMIMNNCVFYNFPEILYYIRTSQDFFKRRGGIKYLKFVSSFKYKYYKKGFFSLKQFLKTAISSFVVSLMPNWLRTWFYKKYLRN